MIKNQNIQDQLECFKDQSNDIVPISELEFSQRISKATQLIQDHGLEAIYLHCGSSLYYFTGMKWNPSERMVGAILTAKGQLHFIGPKFEEGTIYEFMKIKGELHSWEEHESPYRLFYKILDSLNIKSGSLGIDESAPFFITNGLAKVNRKFSLIDARPVISGCRMYKSKAELALMQKAKDITLNVLAKTKEILRSGITSQEVCSFINQAHINSGAAQGSYFCITLFGIDSSFPHGVKSPKKLAEGEVVLIDTGCLIEGYISDITRTYIFGKPTEEQRKIWNIEKEAQLAAFDAAVIGKPCSEIDAAARKVLVKYGLGPDYRLPGTPHRTGHGIGLNIHEWPYIVRNETTLLAPGMTFSIEPMICVPDKFGIRLEDHVYMTDEGPKWFTAPSKSIDEPFGVLTV